MEDAVRPIASGFAFLEGPRWRDGNLYVSDLYTHRVLCFDEAGASSTVCTVPGMPSGLGFAPDGALLIVSMTDKRVLRRQGEELLEVVDLSGMVPGLCNDMVVDARGRCYVGNLGWDARRDSPIQTTKLILVDVDGSARTVGEDLVFPNGIVITADGRQLLVAESFASRISSFTINEDGSLAEHRIWAQLPGRAAGTIDEVVAANSFVPDGMALDADGAVWLADASGTGAARVTAGGTIQQHVDTSPFAVYATALGGRDRKTLYMCASPPLFQSDPQTERKSCLLACKVEVPGAGVP